MPKVEEKSFTQKEFINLLAAQLTQFYTDGLISYFAHKLPACALLS